ncbi:hypothetical protein ACHAWF_004526, partial [Thalassiosira exigua]
MLVEWKDGTSLWMPLRDVKEASPVELAEYAVAMDLDKEPALAWWVDYLLRKRKMIIKKAKSKYWRTTHKYGIQIPNTPEEALRIDREAGTDFWEKAMIKEMSKAKVSYELVDGCTPEENDEYGPPTTYLGGQLERFTIPGTSESRWSLLSTQYVKAAVANVEAMLREEGREFKTANGEKAMRQNAIPSGYRPELDTTEEIGHLEAVYCIFHYLKRHPKVRLVMDPATPVIDRSSFNSTAVWAEFYGDVVKEDPPGMPEPLGQPVEIFAFCDSDHASNVVTRRSHSGIFLFAQNALIRSFSKKQNTVEASTYGAELVAMRIARDMIVELRLKLKSIGVPMVGPANVFCDNQGVVKNTSIPESMLSKKHNSINYHIVREAAAAGILRVAKEDT